jgi:oligoribonuclease
MSETDKVPTKILWVDLEMTGLDPTQDFILEVAAEITDFDFKTIKSYEAWVKNDQTKIVKRMQANLWWQDYPANRDEFIKKAVDGKAVKDIEQDLIKLVDENFGDEPALLAGNSIHNDRQFVKQHMPNLDLKLHYRMLDVSAWKVLMQAKYGVIFEKKEVHRAFDDIQASIAELEHYLEWFQKEHRTNP